jgi:hypothetical protein
METDEIKGLINDIIGIVKDVPEPYKQRCFEILLATFLREKLMAALPGPSIETKPEALLPPAKFTIPVDVRAFLQQHEVPEEKLAKLFLMEGADVRPIYKITATKKAVSQIQLTLLTSLENALRGEKFEFSIETIRQKCIEHKCLDSPNFVKIFRVRSNLFKDLSDKEHVILSPDGKAELAEVIMEIAK